MIAIFRARPLQLSETRWLYPCLDSQVGLVRDKDVKFVDSVHEALTYKVILGLGADSYQKIVGHGSLASDVSIVGSTATIGDASAVFTWDVAQSIVDPAKTQDFLAHALLARMFLYGLGNRNTGYVGSLKVSDGTTDTIFSMDRYDEALQVFRP